MAEECCCVPEAGAQIWELPGPIGRPSRAKAVCPECGQPGKPVQGQTVSRAKGGRRTLSPIS